MNRIFKHSIFLLAFLFSSFLFPYSTYPALEHPATKETYCAYAHFLNAELKRLSGNNEEVIQEYEKAVECDPSSFYLRKGLIIFLLSQNKIESAKNLAEETLGIFPDKDDLALVLSQLYKNEGKKKKAIRILERVVKKDPGNQSANFLLFTLFLDDKKWEEAEKYAHRFIELAKEEKGKKLENPYTQVGLEYAKVGDFTKGLEYLGKACEISPDEPGIHLAIGMLHEGDGELEEALEEYKKALSLSPFSLTLYYRLGETYSQLDRLNEAISIYEEALRINSNDYVSSTNLAQLYYKKGKYEEGLKILQDCPIKDARIYYLMGTFLVRLKRMEEAEENLKKSIQLTPNSYIPYFLLIQIYCKQEKKDEALSILNNTLEKSLFSKEKLYLLFGIVHSQFKDYEEAISYLKKAYELAPDDNEIVFQLAASYERNKNWFRAVYHLRKAIKINPENAEALNYLGYMFAEKGIKFNEATFMIEKALEIEPENGYFIDSLGWVYYQRGLLDKALQELKKAIQLLQKEGEDDPIIREHLGDVYYQKGSFSEAKEQWGISLSLDSTREEVKKKLEEIENKLREE